MKKIILTLAMLLLTISNIQAQEKSYWACMAVTVDNWGQTPFVDALDNFMNSQVGQLMPYTVTLSEVAFTNGNDSSSHQLCFIGSNADSFAMWGSGPPTTAEGKLVNKIFQDYAVMESSNMGSPLIFDPTKLGYEYASVWSVDVSNIPAYARSVQEFISETKAGNFLDLSVTSTIFTKAG